ncbi:MAG: sugar transferase [Faecousia sp.]
MYQKNLQGWMKHIDFILLDMLCLNLAFIAAYFTRNGLCWPYESRDYVNLSVVLTLVDFTALIAIETMKGVLRRGYYLEFAATAKHVILVELIAIFYMFVIKESATYSRIILVSFAVYYLLLSYTVRVLWKNSLYSKHRSGNTALYIVTTCDRAGEVVARYLSENPSHYLLTGICLLDTDQIGDTILGVPVNTNRGSVLQFLCREWVDEVVVSIPAHFPPATDLVDRLVEMGIVVHIEVEQETNLCWQRQEVETLAGRTVLTVGMNMATPMQAFLKRALDIAGGLVGCVLTLVLTIILGPMIYVQSPGPIFFSQTRVGKNGKLFKMYKFRSMYPDAEARKAELMAQNRMGSGGLMFKLDYDPRIIGCRKLPDGTIKKGIGNYIRDWSLDEFPQFWNCLKGDLSLVGTRPPTVDEWEKYDLHHRARLAIKPGITGMWQVSGRSKITDFEQVVELDKKYIREWSMGLDFRILLQTVKVVLRRDGAM